MKQHTRAIIAAFAVVLACAAHVANAADEKWGDLTGQFTFAGPAPPKPIKPDKDVAFCSKTPLVDESLVVNPLNKGLANVVVWLQPAAGVKLAVHPDYAAELNKTVTVDNKGCRFDPHTTLLRTGQKLVVTNGDAVGHNTMINAQSNPALNLTVPIGGKFDTVFKDTEVMPVTIACSMHNWMTGRLIVKDHPYVAISDKNGKFTLKNMPAGDATFRVWHDSGWVKELNGAPLVSGKLKGIWKVAVKEGANDAGELKAKLNVE